jgi:phosphomevalonate kinase
VTATASAPGKLLLAGEYAVLDGAPAIVMAVDRRAAVSRVALESPGVVPGSLLHSVCAAVGCPCPGEVAMDTGSFHAANAAGVATKIGLGSSAALCAALCRLLLPADVSRERLLRSAIDAHRRFQNGAGSGVDVAASVLGGVVRFRMDGAPPVRLSWPQGLGYSIWWSGVPASTPQKLARLSRAEHSPARLQLADAASRIAEAWSADLSTGLLPALDSYIAALERFDHEYRLGVFDAGHGELRAAARSLDVLYKPCGAGGGDAGIAFAADAAALGAFAEQARQRGFTRMHLSVDDRGAALEETAP